MRDYDPNIPSEMGFAHRRRRFSLAKPVTITARRAVNSNSAGMHDRKNDLNRYSIAWYNQGTFFYEIYFKSKFKKGEVV